MAAITLEKLSKSYGATPALREISLSVRDGELLVLVGPSGCGKSTLLRAVAGLEGIDRGHILIGDRRVDTLPPSERGVAMVFQDYALYPHMTVRQNIEFGLKMRKLPAAEIAARLHDTAEMLGIEAYLDRKPAELSGGQRQRVAIARAISKHAPVLLFDEPLSNLDALLRARTRIEIAALHRRLGSTSLYVTHDQIEAMTLADRIALLDQGVLQQVGPPSEVYDRPRNRFVASFLGSPRMNFLEGVLATTNGHRVFAVGRSDVILPLDGASAPDLDGPCVLGFRAEAATIEPKPGLGFPAEVILAESHGHETHLITRPPGIESEPVILRTVDTRFRPGDVIGIRIDPGRAHWFEPGENGQRLEVRAAQFRPRLAKRGNPP